MKYSRSPERSSMTDENKGFMLFKAYKPMIDLLSDEQAGKLLRLLFEYFGAWEAPEIDDGMVNMAFVIISADMKKADEKWEKTVTRNTENGRKGGRPRKAEETEENPPKPKKPTGFLENPTEPKKANIKVNIKEKENNISDPLSITTAEPVADAPALADCEAIPLHDGTEWKPTADLLAEWERLYPGVNVRQAIAEMRGWCLSNPTRRKTRKGVQTFVTSWLGREQNRSPGTRDRPQKRTKFDNFPSHGTDYDALMWASVTGGLHDTDR